MDIDKNNVMDLPAYEDYECNVYHYEKTVRLIDPSGSRSDHRFDLLPRNFNFNRSMMSNHSPNSHREMFELKETNSTPASTSKECDRGDNLLKGSAIVDATDSVPMNSAYYAMNNASNIKYIDGTLPCINDKVPLAENEDLPNSSGTSVEPKDTSKHSDETNKPDDSYTPKDEVEPENEEDLCLKCVYVSVKCCECTIM